MHQPWSSCSTHFHILYAWSSWWCVDELQPLEFCHTLIAPGPCLAVRPQGSYPASPVDNFLAFYHFCFELLKPDGKKYVEKDLGCAALLAIWKQVPGRESPHIDSFVDFLNASEKILSINQDQWKSFVQFSKQVLSCGPLGVEVLLFLSA